MAGEWCALIFDRVGSGHRRTVLAACVTVGPMTARSWFDDARFGMFVHWSHCCQLGCDLSWPLVGGPGIPGVTIPAMPVADYHAGADTFCPEPGSARQWMAIARRAGMRYAVLTTKHHDGFALWPTEQTDWSIARTSYAGDLVAEFVEAARAENLRVGFYFSLPDWHHPDYPALTEADRPYAFLGQRRSSPEAWSRFVDVLFGQVRELLTGYGPIDLLWWDLGFERTPEEWRAAELESMIRGLQPDILLNDRLVTGGGDFETAEQFIPPTPPPRRWEACMTMNDSWGYVPSDHHYKSERELVHALCEVAGRGGNLLLNVSPTATGDLPAEQIARLEAVARWMDRHAAAIHDTEAGLEPWQWYGPSTRRQDRIYCHLLWRPYDRVTVRGLPVRQVAAVRDLATGTELAHTARCSILDLLINSDPPGELVIDVPPELVDPLATVIEIQMR
jgi:alpha-L-fucosidase